MGQLRDLQTKLQLDISTKRSLIDNLSSQMASLARYQTEQRTKYKEREDSMNRLSDSLFKFKQMNWNTNYQYLTTSLDLFDYACKNSTLLRLLGKKYTLLSLCVVKWPLNLCNVESQIKHSKWNQFLILLTKDNPV